MRGLAKHVPVSRQTKRAPTGVIRACPTTSVHGQGQPRSTRPLVFPVVVMWSHPVVAVVVVVVVVGVFLWWSGMQAEPRPPTLFLVVHFSSKDCIAAWNSGGGAPSMFFVGVKRGSAVVVSALLQNSVAQTAVTGVSAIQPVSDFQIER